MRRTAFAAFGTLAVLSLAVIAHEGHQPLPTRGVQVDLKQGRIILARSARDLIDVQTADVTQQVSERRLRGYATTEAPWTGYAVVTSRLPGRIVSLSVRPGDAVAAGQVLAEMESLELQTLQLDYRQAVSEIQLSDAILKGLEPAAQAGSVPGQRLLEAQITHQQNLNALSVLKSKAVAMRVDESRLANDSGVPLTLPIVSPIRGVVVHSDLTVGKVVEPTEHLMDVVDPSSVRVRIGIVEEQWNRVANGQSVQLTFPGLPGQTLDGTITRQSVMLDTATQQGVVWATLSDVVAQSLLRPGMNGQATVRVTGGAPSLSVPSTAVRSDGAERYVLVAEAETKNGSEYQKVSVVIGNRSADRAEILAGRLLPGDRVVTTGGHELSSVFFSESLRITDETARAIGLRVDPFGSRGVDRVRTVDAVVELPPDRRVVAATQLGGVLQNIVVDQGDKVETGDVLAEVASLELRDLQLELWRAALDRQLWRETLERRRIAEDAVSRRLVLESEGRVRSLETQVAAFTDKLLSLGISESQIQALMEHGTVVDALPVRAPRAGYVADFSQVLGQVVRADDRLFEIHDPSQIAVRSFISERDAALVSLSQPARVRVAAFPNESLTGKVARIGPVLAADSRVLEAWIELDAVPSVRLLHNMRARVALVLENGQPVPALPLSAVIRDGLQSFVFVQKSDGSFERRRVYPGDADDQHVVIQSGLTDGESIATSGVEELQTAFAAVR